MKVIFHTTTLNYRGTTVAVTDYARYNQEILGNESLIVHNSSARYTKDMGNEEYVINKLKKEFNVISYEKENQIIDIVEKNNVDVSYFIKSGEIDSLARQKIPSKVAVHAVFQKKQPHGDRYAYISKWLSKVMSNGSIPYVPHIVYMKPPQINMRAHLSIPEKATVIGRIGGYKTFDIPFAKKAVQRSLSSRKDLYFVFIGTEKFIDHERAIFTPEIHDRQEKSDIINSCDAMIHARRMGESFGLSIAEFLYLNKPVIAWNSGYDKNHTEMLKDSNLLYQNEEDLLSMILNIDEYKNSEDWSLRVKDFSPENVMKKFNEVFF